MCWRTLAWDEKPYSPPGHCCLWSSPDLRRCLPEGHLPALQSRQSHRAKLERRQRTKSFASTWQHCWCGFKDSHLSCSALISLGCCEQLRCCLPSGTHLPHKADQSLAYTDEIRPFSCQHSSSYHCPPNLTGTPGCGDPTPAVLDQASLPEGS